MRRKETAMPKVVLASALARWLPQAAPQSNGEIALVASGTTLRESLDDVFATHPTLRGYILDDHGALRHHVAIFVDGVAVRDKASLDVALTPQSEIYLLQALSGG
jgi:hypothetical protein